MIIILNMEQGSAEWVAARLGLPTASQFDRILTPAKMQLSKGADGYAAELLAEQLLGQTISEDVYDFMQRGKDLEDSARRFYELQREVDITPVGLCLTDDRRAGCSPDGLIGEDGGIEIKCPGAKQQVQYLLGNVADDHKGQVQGALMITGRDWWDVVAYHPFLPPALVRATRDEEYIAKLRPVVAQFCDYLAEQRVKLEALGCRFALPAVPRPQLRVA